MPSPFPGMDPYLERHLFHDVYQRLAAEISDRLTPQIAPHYVARLATYYITDPLESGTIGIFYPDVDVSQTAPRAAANGEVASHSQTGGEVAVTERTVTAPVVLAVPPPRRVKLVTVEIRDTQGNQLVTAIEILSPANKRQPGLDEYLHKRMLYLRGNVNLMEIDLLRQGKRPLELPDLPVSPYFVFLSRVPFRWEVEVWPIQLHEPLPVVSVPLSPSEADVPLDLSVALASIYDRARYDLSIDYQRQPDPPLVGDEAVWAVDCLRAKDLYQ